ncbi:MAG: deoxyribonuclease IV [Prevotella sp.]|nr:deoxyribonuclease IV [Staphylococcus sp.]MCM1349956.1 deoxyribonuclease IV [Prevotella sp.]
MKLGSHVSNNGLKMLVGSVEEAISYGANCFMVYLGAPQNTFRKKIEDQNANEAIKLAKTYGIDPTDIIVHAPYIVNLAQSDDEKFEFAVRFLTQELQGVGAIGAKYMVLHPGAHVGSGVNYGISRIAQGINQILYQTRGTNTVIALETMAGKGTECGKTFEEIAQIIELVDDKSRIGVCLDTCHIFDGGYDIVHQYETVLEQFDDIIGFGYLKVIHVNDSKNPLGSHKDRHENIGFGSIGFEALVRIINDERFVMVPKILETPYIPITKEITLPPYKEEIAMIQSGEFDPHMKEKIQTNK